MFIGNGDFQRGLILIDQAFGIIETQDVIALLELGIVERRVVEEVHLLQREDSDPVGDLLSEAIRPGYLLLLPGIEISEFELGIIEDADVYRCRIGEIIQRIRPEPEGGVIVSFRGLDESLQVIADIEIEILHGLHDQTAGTQHFDLILDVTIGRKIVKLLQDVRRIG